MSEPTSQIGRVIADRYKLTSLLGQGGMGSVWRAEHLMLGSEVAIKLIDPAVAHNEEVRARFVREAKAAAQLRSPHVVQILDYGVDDGVPFIAMELMVGESLSERLDREGSLSAEQTSRIVTEISRALAKAHEAGIVHRDLKPDNVFLVHNDDTEIAKVLDFGVAKKQAFGADDAHMTSTGAVLGTPYYMSPEQAEGLKTLDHRTDIWALAVIAYESIVGRRPFDGDTLGGVFLSICAREKPRPSTVATVPDGFDDWFEKGTARNLDERFASAREAALALRELIEGRGSKGELRDSMAGVDAAAAAAMLEGSGTVRGGGTPASVAADVTMLGDTSTGNVAANGEAQDDLALSTAGIGASALPVRKSKPGVALLLVALLGAVGVGAFVMLAGGGESEDEDALVAEDGTTEDAAAVAPEPDVPLEPEPEPEKTEPEPEPESKPEPKKPVATTPAPAPRVTATRPAPVRRATPRPTPKRTPKPAKPTPTPAPTSDAVDLGL